MKDKKFTTFIYMGDPQCSRISGNGPDYSAWGRLLTKAEKTEDELRRCGDVLGNCADACSNASGSRLLVLGGDIVNRGNRKEEWQAFFEAYDSTADCSGKGTASDTGSQTGSGSVKGTGSEGRLLVTPVTGARESIGAFRDRFLNTGNGPAGYENNFFSFDYGCCHFLVLDSDLMGNTSREACKYIGYWIKADLAANTRPVVMTIMHHPMHTLGTSFEDDMRAKAMRENFMALLYRWGVDFILCGHQHAYCRTRETGTADTGRGTAASDVTQVMGVSGTKHFDGWDKSKMDVCVENVSVATIFETDGDSVTLITIDESGRTIDRFTQKVRPPKERHCSTCDNFSKCGGTGEYEKRKAEENARLLGDPLKPADNDGIAVIWKDENEASEDAGRRVLVSEEQIGRLDKVEVEYSLMMRGRLSREIKEGVRLEDILEKAGWKMPEEAEGGCADFALVLTSGNGHRKILKMKETLEGACFRETEDGEIVMEWIVPAILFKENGGYRLACGQENPAHYNIRSWGRDIREVEIVRIELP